MEIKQLTFLTLLIYCLNNGIQAAEGKPDKEVEKLLETPPEYLKIVNGKLVKYPYTDKDVVIDLGDYKKKNNTKRQTSGVHYFDDLDADETQLELQIPSPLGESSPKDKKSEVIEHDERAEEEFAMFQLFGGNPSKTSSGEIIIDGDVAIHKPEDDEKGSDVELQMRKGTANPIILWPKKQLKYEFDKSITPQTRRIIEDAMEHWEEHTCLTFKERAMFDDYPFWYIRFRNDLSGCYSYIGNVFLTLRGQDVSIGKGCENKDIVIHEIGHAVGFFHEQARSDRQEHAVLLPENIASRMQPQFSQQMDKSFGTEYDFGSIMHYSSMAFSKRPYERNTLVTRNPHNQRLMGKYTGLTFRDRKIANNLYDCNADCPNLETTVCENGGYLKPFRKDYPVDCECDCPTGTSGKLCENITGDYYPEPVCGGNITEPTTIETPNYPERLNPYEDCSWWIQAPQGQRVRVEFQDFSFDKRLDKEGHIFNGLCTYERVEIRTKDLYHGDMYCAEDIEKGKVMESRGQDFIILITANAYKNGRGLKADVTFF